MSSRTKVALLYGGKSGEHEISLMSACSVLKNLDRARYEVIPIAIDKEGRSFLHDADILLSSSDKALPVHHEKAIPLPSLIVDGVFAVSADVIFPVMHGPLYEDGALQGLFELANIAYVGCDVLSSALGMHKDMARRIVCRDGIQSARYKMLTHHLTMNERDESLNNVIKELGFPLFVKPCQMGSSVGTTKVTTKEALKNAVSDAMRYDDVILIEEAISGREIEVAVLENRASLMHPHVSILGEIKVHHPDGFYSYAAKYLQSDLTELCIPAEMDEQLSHRVREAAAEIFSRLMCKGLARVDFFVNDSTGMIYFNEINSMPGFTSISMYAKLWQASGMDYPTLLDSLIELAVERHSRRQLLVTDYQ